MSYEWKKLREPLPPEEIEWRVQSSGKGSKGVWARVLAYLTARGVMNRLDAVFGPENWRNEYASGPEGGVLCGIAARVGDEWVTKWDGAPNTDIESVKGGLSDAMKRCAVQWGIGRYLYDLPVGWADVNPAGKYYDKLKSGESFRWDPPQLPDWALPGGPQQGPAHNVPAERPERPQETPEENGATEFATEPPWPPESKSERPEPPPSKPEKQSDPEGGRSGRTVAHRVLDIMEDIWEACFEGGVMDEDTFFTMITAYPERPQFENHSWPEYVAGVSEKIEKWGVEKTKKWIWRQVFELKRRYEGEPWFDGATKGVFDR